MLGPETAGGTSPQNAHGADLWSSAPTVLLCVLFCSDTPRHLLRQPQGSHPWPPSTHQQETTICLSAGPYYICYLSSTTRRAHSTCTSKVSAHLSAFLSRALHFPAHIFLTLSHFCLLPTPLSLLIQLSFSLFCLISFPIVPSTLLVHTLPFTSLPFFLH